MPTISVISAHNLSQDFDRPTRPYVTVRLGGLKLGKTTILFEPSDSEGMLYRWLEDDESSSFHFKQADIDRMFDSDSDDDSDEENSRENGSTSSSSAFTDSSDDSSEESSVTEGSNTLRSDITICCYNSVSHRKAKFLGHIVLPISDVMDLDPGVILTQKLPLEPKRGQSHKHVQGELTVTLQSGTVHELLTKILKDEVNTNSVEALKRSRLSRKRNEEMSKKVDNLLDHHWNRLETVAKERVDKQLVAKGVVKAVDVAEPKKSYIEQVMLGLTSAKKKPPKEPAPAAAGDDGEDREDDKKLVLKDAPPQTPAEARRLRLVQAGAKLQPLNQGVKERREAEFAAEKQGNKMKAWRKYDDEDPSKNMPYALNIPDNVLESTFGIAVSLHFYLIKWLFRLSLLIGIAGVYLSVLCWQAYVDELSTSEGFSSSGASALLRVSVLSFRESSDGVSDTYAWIVSAQTIVTIAGMTFIRILLKRETVKVEDLTTTSADYAVEIKRLPRKFLIGDPAKHAMKGDDKKKKKNRHKKRKHRKKHKDDEDEEKEQELTAQDVADHFAQFGPVVHVALSFDVKKFWDLVKSRDVIKRRIEKVHQLRAITLTASMAADKRKTRVMKLEKRLTGIYKELAVCNKKIRRMDMGEQYFPDGDENVIIPTGCCTFDKASNHKFKTTGKAYVMFRFKKDAELCISQLNKAPRTVFGFNYSRAGNNLRRIMRDSKHKPSSWLTNIVVRRPPEPQDIIWRNMEYSSRSRNIRQVLVWLGVIPTVLLGFFATCFIAVIKLRVNDGCFSESTGTTDTTIFPLLESVVDLVYSESSSVGSDHWFCKNGIVYLATGLSSIAISLVNVLLSNLMIWLTRKFERAHLKSKIQGQMVFRVAIVQYLNTTVSLIMTYNTPDSWGNEGNLLDSALLFVALSISQPLVNTILKLKMDPFVQSLKRRGAKTTKELNETYLPPPFDLEKRYASVVCIFMTAVFFFPLIPITPIIASVSLAVTHACDKYLLLRTCNSKSLLFLGPHGAEMAVNICGPFIVLTSVTGFLIMSAIYSSSDVDSLLNALESEAIKPYSILVWVVVVLYVSLPLWRAPVVRFLQRRKKEVQIDIEEGRYGMFKCLCCKMDAVEGQEEEGEGDGDDENTDQASSKRGSDSPGRRFRKSKAQELEDLTSRKEKREIDQARGDFFNDPTIINVVRHYQAPTPTCMLRYQVLHPQHLPNHSVDATIILDPTDNGQMTSEDFREALKNLGVELKEHQAAAIVQLYDKDGDGFVSTDEFMDAAHRYVDEDGNVDFYAFASGVVKELEEEFGESIHDFDSHTSSDSDEYSLEGRRVRNIVRGGSKGASGRDVVGSNIGFATPPIPTEDVFELEQLISKKWKVEHHEKAGSTHLLQWEDYEGTGIKRPKHMVHIYAGMSAKDRAKIAYNASMRSNASSSFPTHISTPRRPYSGERLSSPTSPGRGSDTSSVTHDGGLSPSRSTLSPSSRASLSPGKRSGTSAFVPNLDATEEEVTHKGYWKDGKYVSAAEAKILAEEQAAASQLVSSANINISSEAEDIYYRGRKDSLDNTLSASLLNLSAKMGREVSAAGISDDVAVEKLIDLQSPGGFWRLSAAMCVQLKCQLGRSLEAKPGGCEKEVWATMIVLEFFERYCPRLTAKWQLSAKIANMWIEKRSQHDSGEVAVVSKRFDEAVRKRARKFLKRELTSDDSFWSAYNYEESSSGEEESQNDENRGVSSANSRGASAGPRAWSSNNWKRKCTAEEEHRKKLQVHQWKKASFAILASMTGKERHENPLADFFMYDSIEGADSDGDAEKKVDRSSKLRRSVQFDPVAHTNEGDKEEVPLPPLKAGGKFVVGGPQRHAKSSFQPVLEEKGAQKAANRDERQPTVQSLGLKCSVGADRELYVEIKPLCARHFVLRQPPPVPGGGEDAPLLNPTLVCVAHFGQVESSPVRIFAGGTPPGYLPDVIRAHFSPHFSVVKFKLFQTPNIDIGSVDIDVREKMKELNRDDKLFVFDISGPGGQAKGYFGQLAVTMRLISGRKEGGGQRGAKVLSDKSARVESAKKKAKASVSDAVKVLKAASVFSDAAKKLVEKGGEDEEEEVVEAPVVQESDSVKLARIVQSNMIPDNMVTKLYNITTPVGVEKRKRIVWDHSAAGTYKLISTCPEVLVPLQNEIVVGIGDNAEKVIRLMLVACNHTMVMPAGLLIVREGDGRICEALKFMIRYEL